jgi:hypothetical protein
LNLVKKEIIYIKYKMDNKRKTDVNYPTDYPPDYPPEYTNKKIKLDNEREYIEELVNQTHEYKIIIENLMENIKEQDFIIRKLIEQIAEKETIIANMTNVSNSNKKDNTYENHEKYNLYT